MYFIQLLETNKNLNPHLLGVSIEVWIQLIIGIISSIAIMYASNTAINWNKKNKEEKDLDELSYFLGCLKILQETMGFYHVEYMIGEETGIVDLQGPTYLNSQIESLISEINNSKVKLVQLLRPYYDTKDFLYLLFSLNTLFSHKDSYYYEHLETEDWDEKIKSLTKFNDEIAEKMKHNKKSFLNKRK